MRRAQEDYLKKAQIVREDLRELRHLGKEAAKELITDAKRAAVAGIQQGKQRVSIAGDRIVSYVEEHPMKSVLYAAAAGALIGAMWSRRRWE
jgi:ElaB/YqjD/DUF883 family membrane-anchored ribosome-binding protein